MKRYATPLLAVGLLTLAAVIVAAAILGIRALPAQEPGGLELDPNARTGLMPGIDMDARLAQLQNELDESEIAFSVNTAPVFGPNGGAGNLLLENPAQNAKLLQAKLVLDNSREVLYTSRALAPGSYLEQVRLDRVLPPGSYPATLYLLAYREDTQEFIGQTGAALTLTVEA